ncbi:MAG: PxKF domain-containing protein [Candidatus Omnitrophota bacterium]|nr:PxKF domain-containing protein [Candidatus Omnitrophota bacterium]
MVQSLKAKPNKKAIILRGLALFFICSFILCLGFSGVAFAQEQDITISSNTTWEAGVLTYNNILVTNGAVLTLNGAVTVNAHNLTVDSTSSISADSKGYPAGQGPGSGTSGLWCGGSGGSYGGNGGIGNGLRINSPTYGSATLPVDLGSGGAHGNVGNGGAGGGAIQLNISGALIVNGAISANGQDAPGTQGQGGGGSGGSIYIVVNNLSGTGSIMANGGKGGPWCCSYGAGGGGGRIAVYSQSSNFTGGIEAKGGIGNGNNSGAAGTVGLFDTTNNYFYSGHNWRFQENDSPFAFNRIVSKDSKITSEGNISLAANSFIMENSNFTISGKEILNISSINLIGSIITTLSEVAINFNLQNLNIDSNSYITADAKGYSVGQGPGAGVKASIAGASGAGYGGRGGAGGAPLVDGGLIYGLATIPIDFGSGGGRGLEGVGGGAIRLTIADTLTVNGSISANGHHANQASIVQDGGGSGGSIYIIAKTFNGVGSITANGGKSSPTGGGAAGGGGGGGRIAIYYQTLSFTGNVEAKGGIGAGHNGEDGTVVIQEPSPDAQFTFFTLSEKSSAISNSSALVSVQPANLDNVVATGDLNGTVDFTDFEIVSVTTGSFSGKGFSQGNLTALLEGVSYSGTWKGVSYLIPSEKKIYLKGELSGDISGIVEGYLTESVPESNVYDRYQAAWKINRLGSATISAAINLDGTLSYQPSYTFNSGLYFYQANMEGFAFGYYTGPLSAVVTYLRLNSENEYKGKGFSIISYNSTFGQGEAWAYNQFGAPGIIEFQGLSKEPLLGKLSALLDENKSPKILSGSIERLDLGIEPQPDLRVKLWSSQRASPGETVNYIIEYRNDGLKSATEAIIYDYLDPAVNYISASQNAYYDPYSHQVSWNLGGLPAKSVGYLSIQAEILWGFPAHLLLENNAYILDIVLHSTDENGFINGIKFNSENRNDSRMYTQFKSTNNATWFKLYDKTNELTGSLEAYLALKDAPTSRNGVGETSEVVGFRPKWIGYSGGATTLVNQAKNNRLSGDELYLISPQVITKEDIRAAKDQFNKVIIYQGDDLFPNITYPVFGEVTKEVLISMAKKLKPPDNTIENLLENIENTENKTIKNLWVFGALPGNEIRINWSDGTDTGFPMTSILESGEGVEVITIPGIKHHEWIPLLNKFEENYQRWPTNMDLDKLKNILKKDIRKGGLWKSLLEIITAHDPNEMLVNPAGDARPGDKLTYTLNYENEGDGIAFGVYITDTLEEDLDDATLSLDNSGSYDTNTRTITWFIGRLDPGQKGSVTFSINVKQDAQDKAEVINFATVHFPSVPEHTLTGGVVNRITTFIDNIPPTTTATIYPSPTQSGWDKDAVILSLSAVDNEGGLGVAKTEYSFDNINWLIYNNSLTIIEEGLTKVYYKSTDNIGNIEAVKSLEIKIDITLPVITAQALPQPNANGWNNTPVTVSFTATDIPSGILEVTDPILVTTEGENQYVTGEAVDLAGNTATTNVPVSIDLTPPEVIISTPLQGAEYLLNSNILAAWSARDVLSAIAQATGTAPNGSPINTSSVGPKSFGVSAMDRAGNNTGITIIYNVRYSYSGILPPINPDGSSIFKLGRVVPIKFQLKDSLDNHISTAVARIYLNKISNNVLGSEIEAESVGQANTGNLFRYSPTDNQYIFNLGTSNLSEGTWQMRIELDDGSSKYATVSFR